VTFTPLAAPAACIAIALAHREGSRPGRRAAVLAVPFAAYAAWSLAVNACLHPVLSRGEPSLLADVLRLFEPPFRSWTAIPPRNVMLGVALAAGSLLAAYLLRHTVPEVALWLVAETVLVVISSREISSDLLNYFRVAPLTVPGLAFALAVQHTRGNPSGATAPEPMLPG
jgi:hypothetical protein